MFHCQILKSHEIASSITLANTKTIAISVGDFSLIENCIITQCILDLKPKLIMIYICKIFHMYIQKLRILKEKCLFL